MDLRCRFIPVLFCDFLSFVVVLEFLCFESSPATLFLGGTYQTLNLSSICWQCIRSARTLAWHWLFAGTNSHACADHHTHAYHSPTYSYSYNSATDINPKRARHGDYCRVGSDEPGLDNSRHYAGSKDRHRRHAITNPCDANANVHTHAN
jgi:hypothetical protein